MDRKSKASAEAPTSPWYAEGLQFTCQAECAACCTTHGEYAYVYLQRGEMTRIAEFLGVSQATFRRRYTTLDEGHRVLLMDEPECPFLEGARCTIYPVRPAQCRTFPFWEENLHTPKRWTTLKNFCPGIGDGEHHGLRTIREHLSSRSTEDTE